MRTDRFDEYVKQWRGRGYEDDIPDEVPHELMTAGVAPSYKAIALAILKNDWHGTTLGFEPPRSAWYDALKSIEIGKRNRGQHGTA
jgi:predicted phosphoadenosine phosphosulfate sulfurtransferase